MRILIVDDDPLANEMAAAIVEMAGYEALSAENGVEAIEKLSTETGIDMIISDMNMPLISGIELFREVRGQGLNLPFILLTGDNPEEILKKEPCLDACILKDFSMEETLPLTINTVMARHR